MNNKLICEAISKCDHKTTDYKNRLEEMYPAFLYDYEAVRKLNDALLNTLACRDMLVEMLEGRE